jgi:two-component system response regulator AtoC
VFTDADLIEEADVVRELDRLRPRGPASAPPVGAAPSNTSSLMARRTDAERDAVMDALRRARQNRTQAARLLGISRRALYKRLTDFGLLDAS